MPLAEPERAAKQAAKQDVSTDRVVTSQWFRRFAHNGISFAIAVAGPIKKLDQFSSSLSMIRQRRPSNG
jgi:hypothetical protein